MKKKSLNLQNIYKKKLNIIYIMQVNSKVLTMSGNLNHLQTKLCNHLRTKHSL